MGLFNFFNKNEITDVIEENNGPTEEQFIDNTEPLTEESVKLIYDLNEIYDYGSVDFENRGYNDALTNPDTSYKNDNLDLLLMDLDIIIQRAKNYYNNLLKDIGFHIQSRKDAGLIDTVNQLETEKEKTIDSLTLVEVIQKEFKDGIGLNKRIQFSYSRGFNRGLASISQPLLN